MTKFCNPWKDFSLKIPPGVTFLNERPRVNMPRIDPAYHVKKKDFRLLNLTIVLMAVKAIRFYLRNHMSCSLCTGCYMNKIRNVQKF